MESATVLPGDSATLLEEYKTVVAERRFVITSYMQAVWFYIAVLGLAGGQYFSDKASGTQRTYVLIFLAAVTLLAVIVAGKFRAMARHAFEREVVLASALAVQAPYPIMWGYQSVLALLVIVEISAVSELARRVLWNVQ